MILFEKVSTNKAAAAQLTEIKLVCSAAESKGTVLDPAVLGGEYAVLFNDDGSAEFTVIGTALTGLTWTIESGDYVLDYYGEKLRFVPKDIGLELDSFGALTMTFTPVE